VYAQPDGEGWFGFDAVRQLAGLPPEILLVPLPGHTWGHAGVAIDTGSGWLLHAGDAYFYRGEMSPHAPHCTPGLELYQTMMEVDRASRLANQDRLRQLKYDEGDRLRLFCAHDALELEAMRAHAHEAHPSGWDLAEGRRSEGAFPHTPV